MIYTKRKNLERYLGLSESLDTAIRHLMSADLTQLAKGRNEVDGDQVFINRFDYQTMPQEKAIWEGHEKYGDIHVLLSGHEKIGVTHVSGLKVTARKPEEDFVGYDGPVEIWCPMTTEDILIVYPEDIHMVKVIDGESTLVEKACVKFKV
ncbi:MAG: YhcH/YjgK/YiaL family protein [Oscillospiraceae bacterium]|nr:YhcH/YjgK/YiaL family protein [Oscillospiraceae bacterium]